MDSDRQRPFDVLSPYYRVYLVVGIVVLLGSFSLGTFFTSVLGVRG
jgi:hypothetical protein